MKKIAIQIDMFISENKSKLTINTRGRKLLNEIIKQQLGYGTLYVDTSLLQDKSDNDLAVFFQQNMIHNCVIKKIKQLKMNSTPLRDFTNRLSYSVRKIPDLTYYFDLDLMDKQEELYRLGWETRNLNVEDTFNISRNSQSYEGFGELGKMGSRRLKNRYQSMKNYMIGNPTYPIHTTGLTAKTGLTAEDIQYLSNSLTTTTTTTNTAFNGSDSHII